MIPDTTETNMSYSLVSGRVLIVNFDCNTKSRCDHQNMADRFVFACGCGSSRLVLGGKIEVDVSVDFAHVS
jgi:hypothetical protein